MNSAAVTLRFLFDDPHELPPSRVADSASQSAVTHHARDVEVFDVDHLVLANNCQSLPVVIIPSSTRHLPVQDRDHAPRLVLVLRSFPVGGKSPVFTGRSFRSFDCKCLGFGISMRSPSVSATVANRAMPTSTPASLLHRR